MKRTVSCSRSLTFEKVELCETEAKLPAIEENFINEPVGKENIHWSRKAVKKSFHAFSLSKRASESCLFVPKKQKMIRAQSLQIETKYEANYESVRETKVEYSLPILCRGRSDSFNRVCGSTVSFF